MQFVFLNINPKAHVVAQYYLEQNEWWFQVPDSLEMIDIDDALGYLATKRRYPTRTMPTIRNLRTHHVVEGILKVIPWTEYLKIVDTVDRQLMTMYECFCCCEPFAAVFDAKDVDRDEVALVKSPCGNQDHYCCTHCLRTILLNFYSHPVTKTSPQLKCFFPDCGGDGTYALNDFKGLLTEGEFQQLSEHVAKMQVPDTLSVACHKCEEMIVVPMSWRYKNREQIHLGCKQACCAGQSTCWNCMNKSSLCLCGVQSLQMENYAGMWNAYYRPIQRNYELTRDTCLKNLKHIIHHPKLPMAMRCPKCDAWVQKSVACNEMSHCGVKWCYCCGKQTLPNETLLMDHFGHQCPRFESCHFWRDQGAHGYRCIESICYDEVHDCCRPEHKRGRENKNIIHRCMWLTTFLTNTPPMLRIWLIGWLRAHKPNNLVVKRVLF